VGAPSGPAIACNTAGPVFDQLAVIEDSLWAAFLPDLSDFTIQYGSSDEALNCWPSNVKSRTLRSIVTPCVFPCGVFQETLSPLLIVMVPSVPQSSSSPIVHAYLSTRTYREPSPETSITPEFSITARSFSTGDIGRQLPHMGAHRSFPTAQSQPEPTGSGRRTVDGSA